MPDQRLTYMHNRKQIVRPTCIIEDPSETDMPH